MKRFRTGFMIIVLAVAAFGTTVPAAQAAPPMSSWSGAAGGDTAAVDLTASALNLANARLALSQADTSSTTSPRSTARSANLGAAVTGLPLTVESHSESAGPAVGDNSSGVGIDAQVNPLLRVGALTGTDTARWPGDNACLTDTALAAASTTTAGVVVNPIAVATLLQTGESSTSGTTRLTSNGGNGLNQGVTSAATGEVAGVFVLGLRINVVGTSTLTTRATGGAGGASTTYTPASISVTQGATTTPVPRGGSTDVSLDLGALAASVTVRANEPVSTSAANGTSAVANVSVVTVTVRVTSALGTVLTSTINLLPLRSSAVAPAGGIDCPAPQPAAPVVTAPVDRSRTNDNTPTYRGTGVAGATVNLSVDGVTHTGVTTVAADGRWSYTPAAGLADGSHTVRATQTVLGTESEPSGTTTFVVDTAAPAAPVLASPADRSLVRDATPRYTGTAEPNATVAVLEGTTVLGTGTATDDGSFSVASSSLDDGPHTVVVRATDAAGNTSAASGSHTFTVDTTAPGRPVVRDPADGSATSDTTPTITGTAEPGSEVTVSIDDRSVGTTTATAAGTWSLTSPTLSEDDHRVSTTATDAADNVSGVSDTNTFTVDATAPAAPVISTPASGSRTNDSTPVIRGTAEPNASVRVSVGGVTTQVSANGTGAWSSPVVTPLADGPQTATAVQADAAGNVSPSASSTFTVDTVAPAAPTLSTPLDGSTLAGPDVDVSGRGEPGARVVVSLPAGISTAPVTVGPSGTWAVTLTDLDDGSYTVTAVQTDTAGNVSDPSAPRSFAVDASIPAAPVIEAPVDSSVTSDTTPTISGTGTDGSFVTVSFVDGPAYGPVAVVGGRWSLEPTTPLGSGTYTIGATQENGAGTGSAQSNAVTFTVDTAAPDAPVITTPANRAIVTTPTPTIAGTGEPGARVLVRLDGQILGSATTVVGDGGWSLPVTTPLAESGHIVEATQTDLAGNVSGTVVSTFTVDLTAPAPPTIDAPADGSATNDTTPTVSGTGEDGATVAVDVDGRTVGTARVDGTGAWTLDLSTPLASGDHDVRAVQTDPAGNVSRATATGFTVDVTAPDAPVITAPRDGAILRDSAPVVRGTGEAGAALTVTVGGQTLGPVTVGTDRSWTVTPASLAEGTYVARATQVDAAGNVSTAAEVGFTVDRTAPAVPDITSPTPGQVVPTRTPTVVGRAEPGTSVTVFVDGVSVGTATVDGTGVFSLTVTPALGQGAHLVTARSTDAAGNGSAESAPEGFVVDTAVPDAPVIESPADGSSTRDATPSISGTGEPGATVVVTIDGATLPGVVVDGAGRWSLTAPELSDGLYTITSVQTDAAGRVSQASDAVQVTIDTTAAPPVITAPLDGSSTNDSTPTVRGTAEVGAVVTVSVDGVPVQTTAVVVGTDGTWSLTLPDPLADGSHRVTATQTDPTGNVSAPSAPVTVIVDTTASNAPVITSPTADQVEPTSTPTITGTAEAGSSVTVVVDDAVVGTVVAGTDGAWTLTLTDPLGVGEHTVTATSVDRAGNTSRRSVAVTFSVPASPPVIVAPAEDEVVGSRPTISGTGEPGAELRLQLVGGRVLGTTAVEQDGTWAVAVADRLPAGTYRVTASQQAGTSNLTSAVRTFVVSSASPVITSPGDGDTVSSPVQVCGTGEPGSEVVVTGADGSVLGRSVVDENGDFCVTLAPGVGGITLAVTQTDPDGVSAVSDPVSFVVEDESTSGGSNGGSGGSGGSNGSSGGGSLASTGGPGLGAGVVGLLLLGVGAALLVRRRTSR